MVFLASDAASYVTGAILYCDGGMVFEDRNGNGRREPGEPGVAGVKVSDGVEVSVTDTRGVYRLTPVDGRSLFVIKPAGYLSIRREDGLPDVWRNTRTAPGPALKYGGMPVQPATCRDFALRAAKPSPKRQQALDVVVFADPQPKAQRDVDFYRRDIIEPLKRDTAIEMGHGFGRFYFDGLAGDLGISLGDTLAALHGVIGVLLALQARHASVNRDAPKGLGQVVDVALYESVFNCMESLLPEYSAFGAVRQPAGSALPGIAPSNAYPCVDGMVVIGGNGDSIFKRLMIAIGRDDLATDPQLTRNPGRVARVAEIDAAIGLWTQARRVEQVLAVLNAASVPVGRIYTAADIAADPHFQARDMILPVTTPDGLTVQVPGIVPKLSRTPGAITRRAPDLGEDTEAVLSRLQP